MLWYTVYSHEYKTERINSLMLTGNPNVCRVSDGWYYSTRSQCGVSSIIIHVRNLSNASEPHGQELTGQLYTQTIRHMAHARVLAAQRCLFILINSWYNLTRLRRYPWLGWDLPSSPRWWSALNYQSVHSDRSFSMNSQRTSPVRYNMSAAETCQNNTRNPPGCPVV